MKERREILGNKASQLKEEDLEEYRRHYSERAFWDKLGGMPRAAGAAVVERALTLYVILTDRETPLWARALIIAALGYFIWPFDAVPDAIPVVGYADDVVVMGVALTQVDRLLTPAMRRRVQRLMPDGMKTETNERRDRSDEQDESNEDGD